MNAETGSADQVVSKSEYAAMRNRSPSAVSKWIEAGKLTAPALIGSGRMAKVNVRLADAQLREVLDPSQQMAQPAPLTGEGELPFSPAPVADDDIRRRNRARADREEAEAAQARVKAMADQGQWVHRDEAAAAFRRRLVDLMTSLDVLIPEMAEAIARTHGGDDKAFTVTLRAKYRDWRAKQAGGARAEADALPETEAMEEEAAA